jgi:hypothetical protein
MKQTPRPASIDQLLDSIKQEYTNRGGSLGTEQNIKEHCRSFFEGQVLKGTLNSKTATKLVREWIDLSVDELKEDWELARAGKEVKKIAPLE